MNEENENMAMKAVDMAKEDKDWAERKACALLDRRIRARSNCECLVEISHELSELDYKRRKLKDAIEANPAHVSESAKALWPVQLDAMNAYKKALQDRIVNLIETDKE